MRRSLFKNFLAGRRKAAIVCFEVARFGKPWEAGIGLGGSVFEEEELLVMPLAAGFAGLLGDRSEVDAGGAACGAA